MQCWREYLKTKIDDGVASAILCPALDCQATVPAATVEAHSSPATARRYETNSQISATSQIFPTSRRYLKTDIGDFVEANRAIRWCPMPGCQRAVRFPEATPPLAPAGSEGLPPFSASHSVDCGGGHFFCWECGGEAHAPLACGLWKTWLARSARADPSKLLEPAPVTTSSSASQSRLNSLVWLVSHLKPCPNCRATIQKTEGCNHMRCPKCRHDFCWVCMTAWRRHEANGRCNRFPLTTREARRALLRAATTSGGGSRPSPGSERRLLELARFGIGRGGLN